MLKTKIINVKLDITHLYMDNEDYHLYDRKKQVDAYVNEWIEQNNITEIRNISFNSFYEDEASGNFVEQVLILYDDGTDSSLSDGKGLETDEHDY